MDSQKYLKQYAALEEAAKSEIIELLSNNPTGRYIYFNCDIEEESEAQDNYTITTRDGAPATSSAKAVSAIAVCPQRVFLCSDRLLIVWLEPVL